MIIINEVLYSKMPEELKQCFNKLPNQSSEEVESIFPYTTSGGHKEQTYKMGHDPSKTPCSFSQGLTHRIDKYRPSSEGSASRYFYCAKASTRERGEFNKHPTVKPLALMRYLITLITPKNGIVLDPFGGSGTTALACMELNRDYILIEREQEYIDIIHKRIEEVTKEDKQLNLLR